MARERKILVWVNKIVATILASGFIFIAYNFTLNGHYHITDDGNIIYHYHPVSDKSDSQFPDHHSHNKIELNFIDNYNKIAENKAISNITFICPFQKISKEIILEVISDYSSEFYNYTTLRAPPELI